MKATKLGPALLVALVAALILPAAASATYHLVKVREVYPGSVAKPGSEYIELQMYAPGQNRLTGHSVTAYSGAGASEIYTFTGDVAKSANQSTILLATPEAEAQFGVKADLVMTKKVLEPGGGAVCWEALDCVEWGQFFGSGSPLPSATGDAAPAIADTKALRRSIAPGCATLLEAGDDSGDSATDFALAAASPRPNSVTPTEKTCAVVTAPETTITAHPKKKTKSRKAHFGFSSNKAGSTFECSLDGALYAPCTSPVTYSKLKRGRHHHFEVRATAGGKTDPTGAVYDWKVKKKRKK